MIVFFSFTIVAVYFFSSITLKNIIASEKEQDFSARINSIIRSLEKKNEELEKTGYIDNYREFFQKQAVEDLAKTYFSKDLLIFPFILDSSGNIIMHPNHERGSKIYAGMTQTKYWAAKNPAKFQL